MFVKRSLCRAICAIEDAMHSRRRPARPSRGVRWVRQTRFDFRMILRYPVRSEARLWRMTSRRTPIAIIGGGLSGLYVAHLLQKAGTGFQLLEARERFGGRILSVDGSGTPSSDGFDLGPSWYWPGMHPRMAGIVRELQLRDFEQYSDGDVLLERSASSPPQRFPALR